MVLLVVNHAELPRRHAVDRRRGVYDELVNGQPFYRGRMVFGRVTYLKGHFGTRRQHVRSGEIMEIMHLKILLIGCLRVVAMAHIEYVALHIFLHDEPRSASET